MWVVREVGGSLSGTVTDRNMRKASRSEFCDLATLTAVEVTSSAAAEYRWVAACVMTRVIARQQ